MKISNFGDLVATGQTQSGRAQLRATEKGDLSVVTLGKFRRFFSAIGRNQAGRDSNRAGAQAYVAHVRQTKGFEAARFAEAALSHRIDKGKPVSMRKIQALESAWHTAVQATGTQGARAFQAADLVDAGEPVGSGSNNKIVKATFDNGTEVMTGALKPLGTSAGAVLLTGRDEDLGAETYVLDRNLASQRMAECLGVHVIAGGVPAQTAQGKPALLMELVHGDSVADRVDAGKEVLDGPELRRGLVGLQVIDILTGQIDRNLANIMLKRESGRDIPVGIDNDLSFVTAASLEDLHAQINSQAKPIGMPVVLDQSMRQQIMRMTRHDLVAVMGPNLATAGRLEAAAARLSALQAHIASGAVMVIEDSAWQHPQVPHLLNQNADNYWHQAMHARPETT